MSPVFATNGGLSGVKRTTNNSSAPGMWTLEEQALAKRAGMWPNTGIFRYYRFNNFANTALHSNTIDFGEIELYAGDTKHTGITCTTSWAFTSGTASMLVDGATLATRAYYASWGSAQPTATITFDLGEPKAVTHVKVISLYTQPRFPASFDVQGSADNSNWTTLSTVTVGTSFTLISDGVVYSSEKVAV